MLYLINYKERYKDNRLKRLIKSINTYRLNIILRVSLISN